MIDKKFFLAKTSAKGFQILDFDPMLSTYLIYFSLTLFAAWPIFSII